MGRPRKVRETVETASIIEKAKRGYLQMNAPRDTEDPYGFQGWVRVGQAQELFSEILRECGIDAREVRA